MSKLHNHQQHSMIALPAVTPSSAIPSAPTPNLSGPVDLSVTPDRIRTRAYELYQARAASGTYGSAIDDWLAAERELISAAPDSTITQEIELKARSNAAFLAT